MSTRIADDEICAADRKAQEIYTTLVTGETRQVLMWLCSHLNKLQYGALQSDEEFAKAVQRAEDYRQRAR